MNRYECQNGIMSPEHLAGRWQNNPSLILSGRDGIIRQEVSVIYDVSEEVSYCLPGPKW